MIYPLVTRASSDPDQHLREDMKKEGYISVEEAVSKFEAVSHKKVILPKVPFEANHKVGLLSKDGYLSLQWMNTKQTPTQDFAVFVKKKARDEFYFAREETDQIIELDNGMKAYYQEEHGYRLVFEKDCLEYCYIWDKNVDVTKQKLLKLISTY